MLAIELSLDLLIPAITGILFFLLGFIIRRKQIGRARNKLRELEKDLLNSHAEILELLSEKSQLEQKLKDSAIPVIPINVAKEDKSQEKSQEVGLLKKVPGQPPTIQQNS